MKDDTSRFLVFLSYFVIFAVLAFAPAVLSASDTLESVMGNAVCATDGLTSLNAKDLLQRTKAASLPVPTPLFFQAPHEPAGMPVVVTVPGLASRNLAGGLVSAVEGALTHDPDSYLQDRLAKMPKCAAVTIVPFKWGRTFGDTQNALEAFVPQLVGVYDAYKKTGRPIYILAHSWGAVIMHDVLHRVAEIRPDVKIDKFITLGTPLVSRLEVRPVTGYQVEKFHLRREVSKPANLRYWKNIWAERDPFSNAIPAADLNVQIDAGLGDPELSLVRLGEARADLRPQINKDLISLMNAHAWHKSYYKGFKASLKSLNREIAIEVFDAQIAPHMAACMVKSGRK